VNDQLIDTFLSEAHELIVDLEKGLLVLENDQQNKDGISAIFRSMHTLKGAAGMFGYDSVGTITHHLESIYQDIRDGERVMNEIILRITFKTLDQLRLLLSADPKDAPNSEFGELLTAIKQLEGNEKTALAVASAGPAQSQPATYYIYLLPKPEILRNGSNPLYLVDDLLALGTGLSLPFFKDLPSLQDITPDLCYTGFEVVLCTDKTEAEIRDVFMFVEGACEVNVKKISNTNSLSDIAVLEGAWQNGVGNLPIGFAKISESLAIKSKKIAAVETIRKNAKSGAGNIRVSSERLDDLMNLVSELVTTQARLALFSDKNASGELNAISENIEKITRRLRDNAFTMTLIPLESIVVRFQRLVSDLSKELNKEVEFKAEGMDTKIDKSIMEKLTDPILHLLRNSIDHGIESKEQRALAGKSEKGCVQLKSYYSGANVIIEISDDGAGLNLARIKEKAIKQGLIEAHAQLSERELTELIFVPGFSTAAAVTGVSGRGVGMDVVKRNITDIRGEIEITTVAGKGTTFSIKLPLTLSILDGLLVKIGETDFILPLTSVAKCYEVETARLESSFNSWITLEGKRTPFIFLRQDFGMGQGKPALSQIINVPFNGYHVGIAVDKIVGEYQAVLKPLGQFYQQQDEFSGATILGNGTVALVLDTNKLIRKLTTTIK
jgi:two-component system chemotaxis sensor kinase CheA